MTSEKEKKNKQRQQHYNNNNKNTWLAPPSGDQDTLTIHHRKKNRIGHVGHFKRVPKLPVTSCGTALAGSRHIHTPFVEHLSYDH